MRGCGIEAVLLKPCFVLCWPFLCDGFIFIVPNIVQANLLLSQYALLHLPWLNFIHNEKIEFTHAYSMFLCLGARLFA